jgi:non-specific serine/threonine protein kinase
MKPPFKHQTTGTAALVEHPRFLLADVMRLGKTRTAIDAAQELWRRGEIDRAVVVAPGEIARSVWASVDTGQIAEYAAVPSRLTLIRADRETSWENAPGTDRYLDWVVTNYELARRPERLARLRGLVTPRTYLILDEGSAVKNPASKQTKAMRVLARIARRCVILNGTPHGDNPGDLFAPFDILDPDIIGCDSWYQFRAKYAIMGGFRRLQRVKVAGVWKKQRVPVQIVGWTNLADLYDRTRPFILRRTLDEVFDLPPALDPVSIEVPLDPETWSLYRQMKRDALVELKSGERVTAAQAGVVSLRLSQITAGFIGGAPGHPDPETREVGREKLDAVLAWHAERLAEDPRFRVIFWTRFRREAERLAEALAPRGETALLYGGQDEDERAAAIALLAPGSPDRAANLVGIERTGGMGLDLSGASTTVHVSSDYSLMSREQADARPLGPNQKRPCAYFDFVATGPKGEKTVDHVVAKALRNKEDLAAWGGARWAAELEAE